MLWGQIVKFVLNNESPQNISYITAVKDQTKNVTFEPRHKISNNVVCATSKGSDHPAHMRSLIRAFASRLHIL